MAQQQTPTETVMRLTETKQQLSEVVNRVARGETRVVVEKSGLPVAAIISFEEYRLFRQQDQDRAARFGAMSRISEAFADVPVDELELQVERALVQARKDIRDEREAVAAS